MTRSASTVKTFFDCQCCDWWKYLDSVLYMEPRLHYFNTERDFSSTRMFYFTNQHINALSQPYFRNTYEYLWLFTVETASFSASFNHQGHQIWSNQLHPDEQNQQTTWIISNPKYDTSMCFVSLPNIRFSSNVTIEGGYLHVDLWITAKVVTHK